MKIVVDKARCTGHGICEAIAPDIFEVAGDGVVELQISDITDDAQAEKARQAVAQCPSEALTLEFRD